MTHGSAESLITRRQMVASVFWAGFALGGDRLRLELAITFTFGDPRVV